MLPLYLDINTNHDASTTLFKEHMEYSIQTIPTSFEQDLIKLEEFMNDDLISVFTNLSLSNQRSFKYIKEPTSMDDDFDIVSQFKFKRSKRIKARIKKSEYLPSIIIN